VFALTERAEQAEDASGRLRERLQSVEVSRTHYLPLGFVDVSSSGLTISSASSYPRSAWPASRRSWRRCEPAKCCPPRIQPTVACVWSKPWQRRSGWPRYTSIYSIEKEWLAQVYIYI
jgi:hypothetical protein